MAFFKRGSLMLSASLALAIPLAACSDSEEAATGETVSNDTLASELANTGTLSTVSAALNETGLAQVFDGTASYTLLAPTDTAFEALAGMGLDKPENRALLAEVLRDHVLPGAFSEADIADAIESTGGPVEMTTMGGKTVTFAMEGETLTVTSEGGASAAVGTQPVLASNGAAMPIDTVLHQP